MQEYSFQIFCFVLLEDFKSFARVICALLRGSHCQREIPMLQCMYAHAHTGNNVTHILLIFQVTISKKKKENATRRPEVLHYNG